MKAKKSLLLVALLVLAAVSVGLGACGGGDDDQALFEKMTAVWTNEDAALAEEVYATDAVIYWPEGSTPAKTSGIDEIKAMLPGYPLDPTLMGDATLTYVPSAKDIEGLSVAYDGARFIGGPAQAARELFEVVLEVRDGKVATQWVTYMYRY